MTVSPRAPDSLSAWLRKRAILASLIVTLCSLGPRVFLAWRADQADLIRAIPDARTYLVPARNLLERGAFFDADDKPEIARTPGYPVFVATLMHLLGQDIRRVLITQAVVLSLSVVVLYWLARLILPPVTAFIGALLAAFSPWGAVLAGLPLTEGLFLLLLVLVFLAMKLVERTMRRGAIVLGGACVGLLTAAAVMVRPVWPLVILIAAALFVLYGSRKKEGWLLLVTMLVFAVTPLALWKERNQRISQFQGLSDISGKAAWRYLASRVNARVNGLDRFTLKDRAALDDRDWEMSTQEADEERWRRAKAVFREHPIVTVYCFFLSAAEHVIHPSPDVLRPAKLNFNGDYWVLSLLWGGFLILAILAWPLTPHREWDKGVRDRRWLLVIMVICLALTLSSGLSFGAGARYRAPLELIVPLMAAEGLVRATRAFQRLYCPYHETLSTQVIKRR